MRPLHESIKNQSKAGYYERYPWLLEYHFGVTAENYLTTYIYLIESYMLSNKILIISGSNVMKISQLMARILNHLSQMNPVTTMSKLVILIVAR